MLLLPAGTRPLPGCSCSCACSCLGAAIYIYLTTDHGRAILPTLKQPTLNIRNVTRERIDAQLAVRLHNYVPLDLNINNLRYETYVDGHRLVQVHKANPLLVKGNQTNALTLPVTLNLPALKHAA